VTERERAIIALLSRAQGEPVLIAGISECRTAISLANRGFVVLVDEGITPEGGSGRIRLANRLATNGEIT